MSYQAAVYLWTSEQPIKDSHTFSALLINYIFELFDIKYLILLQNKEIEELTKICDELIAKMGRS